MNLLLVLLLLAGVTYLLVRRSASGLTSTPIWLLWLVVMIPAFTWSLWLFFMGEEETIPTLLILIPFIISPLLYFWLLQRGRSDQRKNMASPDATALEKLAPVEMENKTQTSTCLLSASEEEQLKSCFPWEIYYLQKVDYGGQAVLCRGKLRTIPEEAYQKIQSNVKSKFGDRFLILFQESFHGEPFFALVPNPKQKQPKTTEKEDDLNKPRLAFSLALITLLTTTIVGASVAGVTAENLENNPDLWMKGLPYSLSLMWILGCHELGHYSAAIYYKIKTTLPYFIPVPFFLGTFGAFIQMRSPIPHRKALFDVAIAGPIGGLIMTIPLLLWGLSQSEIVDLTQESTLVNIDSLNPRSSLLTTLFCKMALGSQFVAGTAIDLHPIAIAGYIGLIVTALNLMPVGQLDGGHIVHAIYGQRTAIIIGQVSRLLILILSLTEPTFLLWAIILFLMPIVDEPALNDVTELDNIRDLLGFLSLVLLVSILLPLPETVSTVLNV